MSNWKLIRPEASKNLITNPSFETNTTGWTASGTNTIAKSTAQSKFGANSLLCTYQNNTALATFAALTLTAAAHALSAWVRLDSNWDGGAIRLAIANFASVVTDTATTTTTTTGKWIRLELLFTPDAGDLVGDILVETASAPTAGRAIYIDGVDVVAAAYTVTHVDGDQPGCKWLGTEHASTSERDQFGAAGGRILDLSDDLNFTVENQDGAGMPPVNNLSSPLALQPGSLFNGQTIGERNLVLGGKLNANSDATQSNFHSRKQELLKALSVLPGEINAQQQPRVIRYTGADIDKELSVVYDGGLEGGLPTGFVASNVSLRLKADDPLFYQIGESAAALDVNDSATFRMIAGKINGLWDMLGPPDVAGSYTAIYGLAEDDTYIYVGGDFTNFDNIANADYIVQYEKSTGTWSALGTGLNASCRTIIIGADGIIYVGGNFTTAGGSSANYIASWNGSAWSALGTGFNAVCRALVIGTDGILYAGGSFTTADGSSANYIASWNGSAWSALGTGFNNACYALAIGTDGILYASGSFTTAGGSSANYIASWNGSAWSALGTGFNSSCFTLTISTDGILYAGGIFSSAGGIATSDRVAGWNGDVWFHLDINMSGSGTVNSILSTNENNFYVGYTISGTAYFSGNATISYLGTYQTYPTIKIKRSGGTSAKLLNIANVTTDAILYFNYDLLDGEELIIDMRPGKQSITSSFRGNVYNELFPNSDFGSFYLMPGNGSGSQDNIITAFVDTVGTPTMTANMIWKDAYISED